jgi:hypothetical protein
MDLIAIEASRYAETCVENCIAIKHGSRMKYMT